MFRMKKSAQRRPLRMGVALCASLAALIVPCGMMAGGPVPQAEAVTYGQLNSARVRAQNSKARAARLRSQLSGVSASLQNQIIQLDDLNNNQIPAAQQASDNATQQAAQAQLNAQNAAARLSAAQKDEADLKAKIRQTGKNYDDAHAALAEVARDSLHGSNTSDTLSVVMGSRSTKDFIDSMQSQAALSRSEATVADNSAQDLSLSTNREQRLVAITHQVAQLKVQADQQNAAAQKAQADAAAQQKRLQALLDQGQQRRSQLEAQKSQLKSSSAQEAANAVFLQSQLDSMSQQWNAQRVQAARHAASLASRGQGRTWHPARQVVHRGGYHRSSYRPSRPAWHPSRPAWRPSRPTHVSYPHGSRSPGDVGNAYPFSQCTWWVYVRRHQLGLPCDSYFGNGGQWADSARARGYRVDHTPSVGAIIVFAPGQDGASPIYGHVGVVERVNGNGTVTTSECGSTLHGRPITRIRAIAGHWFIH